VEAGETLAAAVHRETLEETGVDVEPGELLGWAERFAEGRHFVILDFVAEAPAEDAEGSLPALSAGDDAAEARWVPLADLGALALVDGLADFLERHGVIGIRGSAGPAAGLV
jgi:8-oxo-dGTP diphosphatase